MKFVDAHVHLSDKECLENIDEIMAEAKNSNVVALVSNSMNLETSLGSLKIAERYTGTVFAALGVHPWNVNDIPENELQQTLDLISTQAGMSKVVAIGEIGLDYKYARILDKQLMVFNEMLHLAEKLGLPVIIHSRGTTAQIVEMLPSFNLKKVLLHWFSNPLSALSEALENGYYITEGPPTVYSNGIREVVRRVPLTNMLTETDGPMRYWKEPFKGRRTTPTFIPMVVNAIAEIKNMDVADVAAQIIRNFQEFFTAKLN